MNKGLISVIIPCYNVEKYILKTIASLIAQNYKKYELILVNDGSTDKTLNILKEFQKEKSNIKVIDKKNSGVSSSRNAGLKIANGEYIYFLDGDDTVEGEMLERVMEIFNRDNSIDLVSFGFKIVDEQLNVLNKYSFEEYGGKSMRGLSFLELYFKKKIRQCMCSFVVKKSILDNNNITFPEDISYGEDQYFQIKSLINCGNIYYDSNPYFKYLKRNDSAVNKSITSKRVDLIKSFIKLKEEIKNEHFSDLTLRNLNNFIGMIYIFLLKEGKHKNGDQSYFNELEKYSENLNNVSLNLTRYGMVTFILSKLYLFNKKIVKKVL